MDDQPEVLAECAKELFSFKGKEVDDPELKAFAKSLAIETGRESGLKVPLVLTNQIQCKMSVIEFERQHLPKNCIGFNLLPVLTHPATESIMVLPCWYWPEDFKW